MKREFLENLQSEISKDDITTILNEVHKERDELEGKQSTSIDELKKQVDELTENLKTVTKERDTYSKQIESSNADMSVFNEEIEGLKKTISDLKAENKQEKINHSIQSALKDAGAIDNKYALVGLDMEKIKLDKDGNVTGVNEQVSQLKKDKPFLFTEPKQQGYEPRAGKEPSNSFSYGRAAAEAANKQNNIIIKGASDV